MEAQADLEWYANFTAGCASRIVSQGAKVAVACHGCIFLLTIPADMRRCHSHTHSEKRAGVPHHCCRSDQRGGRGCRAASGGLGRLAPFSKPQSNITASSITNADKPKNEHCKRDGGQEGDLIPLWSLIPRKAVQFRPVMERWGVPVLLHLGMNVASLASMLACRFKRFKAELLAVPKIWIECEVPRRASSCRT